MLLWLWPKIRAVYGRCELQVDLLDPRIFLAGVTRLSEEGAAAEPAERWAISGAHAHGESRGARVPGAQVLLVALLCAVTAQAAPSPDALNAVHNAFRGFANPFRMGEAFPDPSAPQGGGSQGGPAFRFDGSYNLLVNCITGCMASSGFTDNSTFTVGTSTINPIGALYSTSTPSISSGNAGRVRMDSNSYLLVDCIAGCSASAGFADNSAFTVGTTAINTIGGLYDTGADPSISNGNAGRARIDSHSYLFTDIGVALPAGSNIIGKVGIDQTTPGTTNAVQDTNFPTTADTNTGNASASTIREAVATNNPAIAAWGQGATGSAVPLGAVQVGGNGSGNLKGYINCDNTYVNNGLATSGSTQAVALSSGKSIYICDFFVNTASTTAVNVKLVYGTGTNCATSPSDLSILVPMQAPTSIAPAGQNVTPPGNVLWVTPASQAVCVNLSSANAVNVMFHWTQF